MVKRGQLSLFIIIGTVLILSIGLATYFMAVSQSQKLKPSINLEQKKQSVSEYIESCFSDTVKEARNKYGLDKEKIESYVDENICKDFSEFEEGDLSISFTGARTDVEISQNVILAEMKYLILMRLGLSSQSLEEFSFDMAVTTTTQIPTQDGVVSEDTVLRSGDGLLELFVAKGIRVTDENGNSVENPEVIIKLTEVKPNPTTYGLGIYEVEPHLIFSKPITLRLRYYDLHLGKEENLKVIKRPGPSYLWKIVPDQDAPYTDSNLMIARLTDLSQIALTAKCGSGEETSIYFYTNYVYIQNCEPCKCFKEDTSASAEHPLYLDDTVFGECSDQNKISPGTNEEKLEEKTYEQKTLFDEPRGGTSGYKNIDGCKEEENTLFYDSIEAVGGTGEFNLTFEIGEGSCIHEIRLEREDVDNETESIKVDDKKVDKGLGDVLSSFVKEIDKEDIIFTRNISLDIKNTKDTCSHARFLINVSGTGIKCNLPADSIAKCCTEANKKECDWEKAVVAGCNKLGFHTLVQDTSDQNLIDKHLEVAHEFSGDNGWVLNTIWTPQAYDPAAYVEEAIRLKLRPIIRLDVNYKKPSMEDIDSFVDLVNSIPDLYYVQFLNEPNYEWPAWGSSNIPPQDYAKMLIEFSKKVHALDKKVYVIAGNLGPNDQVGNAISTEDYIKAMFSIENVNELVDAIDIWGSHSKPRGELDPVGEPCDDCDCKIESVYGYKKELCLIKQKLPNFDKPVFITETGYINTANDIAGNMQKAFAEWDKDSRVLGVTIFILAPIGTEWADHAWATIPQDNPENWQPTPYFTAIKDMQHSPVCPDIELPGPEDEGNGEPEGEELDVPWTGEERPPAHILSGIKLFSAPTADEDYYWKLESVKYLGNAGGRYTIRVMGVDENIKPSITPSVEGCDGPYYKPEPDNFWEFQCDVQTGISTMAREVYVTGQYPSEKIKGLLAGNENTHCGYYLTFQRKQKT